VVVEAIEVVVLGGVVVIGVVVVLRRLVECEVAIGKTGIIGLG